MNYWFFHRNNFAYMCILRTCNNPGKLRNWKSYQKWKSQSHPQGDWFPLPWWGDKPCWLADRSGRKRLVNRCLALTPGPLQISGLTHSASVPSTMCMFSLQQAVMFMMYTSIISIGLAELFGWRQVSWNIPLLFTSCMFLNPLAHMTSEYNLLIKYRFEYRTELFVSRSQFIFRVV